MFIFYVDESGSPHQHNEPLQNGQTPIFVLASLAFQAEKWRHLDREYLSLKSKFFPDELKNKRAEQHEIKGTSLISPHNKTSRRRHAFANLVFKLCIDHHARGFAVIFRKNSTQPVSPTSMYTMALQYLVERFHCFLDETTRGYTIGIKRQHAQGIIVADSRLNNLDLNVAISHLSFIFGHPIGQKCTSVVEAPTFTFSQLSVGVQLTDIFASYVYARAYLRHCSKIEGAHDYSHLAYFNRFHDKIEFWSDQSYDDWRVRGCRYIDFSETA
jgi:hypothetical protein